MMKNNSARDRNVSTVMIQGIYRGSDLRGGLAHDRELSKRRPAVPGKAVEYIYMPARGFMSGRVIKKGQVIRIIDLEGEQCADCIIWDANNLYNVSNALHTMMWNRKWNNWQPGDAIYSKNGDALVIISEDSTDGTHTACGAFCNEAWWRVVFGIAGKPNCRDNFVAAMAEYDFSASDIDWGSCFTVFMPILYEPDGSIRISSVKNKPGDYVDLMAKMDVIFAISNCPSESLTNNYNPTPLQAVIFNPNEEYKAKL